MDKANEFAEQLLQKSWDSKDAGGFSDCFAEDAAWYVNTAPAVQGRDKIKEFCEAMMSASQSTRHHDLVAFTSGDGGTICARGSVEYVKLDGDTKVNCTFCDVFELSADRKIQKAFTFMDTTPLAG
mmetsp:Transcript_9877/g.30179  ORF Transcript_9877/g.30179 Transcript_9877/m.30179 type:complete len:126 (+) Transcript_9877:169-546(+)